jgi:transposase InsO family protein
VHPGCAYLFIPSEIHYFRYDGRLRKRIKSFIQHCVRTEEDRLYLAIVKDLFDRQIVGFSTGSRIDTDLCKRALNAAIQRYRPGTGLIHHSESGHPVRNFYSKTISATTPLLAMPLLQNFESVFISSRRHSTQSCDII